MNSKISKAVAALVMGSGSSQQPGVVSASEPAAPPPALRGSSKDGAEHAANTINVTVWRLDGLKLTRKFSRGSTLNDVIKLVRENWGHNVAAQEFVPARDKDDALFLQLVMEDKPAPTLFDTAQFVDYHVGGPQWGHAFLKKARLVDGKWEYLAAPITRSFDHGCWRFRGRPSEEGWMAEDNLRKFSILSGPSSAFMDSEKTLAAHPVAGFDFDVDKMVYTIDGKTERLDFALSMPQAKFGSPSGRASFKLEVEGVEEAGGVLAPTRTLASVLKEVSE